MTDITCIIMDNLLGKDIASIERIYDLKGSTKGRREQPGPALKVLKDLNFVENGESLDVTSAAKSATLNAMEADARFLQS